MRRVLLVLGFFALLSSRAAAQDAIAMTFRTIADNAYKFSDLDISADGSRVLYITCVPRHWWSFLPGGVKKVLEFWSGCPHKRIVIADDTGKAIASAPFDRSYHNPHFVDRDTIAYGQGSGCDIVVAAISPDGTLRKVAERVVPQALLHSNLHLSAANLDGQIYAAVEHPAGRLAIESLSGEDLHVLDDFDVERVNGMGLTHDIVWFRVAIKHTVAAAYAGPAKILGDYPFPGGGGPGVDEAVGFAAFGPEAETISAELVRNFEDIDGPLPWRYVAYDRSKYGIRNISPGGTVLTSVSGHDYYILQREGMSYRKLRIEGPDGLWPAAVSDNGRVVLLRDDGDGHRTVMLGTLED